MMEKDKELEELFLAQKPKFDDKAQFMERLTKRLDAVEYIKQYQEVTLRRYKMAIAVTFVVGVISGATAIGFLLTTPADVPLFTFKVQTSFLLWFAENSRIIVTTAMSLFVTLGVISIYDNVLDILRMRTNMT